MQVRSAGRGARREEKSITLMHPSMLLTWRPAPGAALALWKGSARRSVLPGQQQVSSHC